MSLDKVIQNLVRKYGFLPVLDAFSDEAARVTLCEYDPMAVKVLDVLKTCREVISCEIPVRYN